MTIKDIIKIRDFALRRYLSLPSGLRLDGAVLESADYIAISYYQGVIDLLVSKGLLKNDPSLGLPFIEEDSNPAEYDYE